MSVKEESIPFTVNVFDNEYMRIEYRDGVMIGTYKRGPVTLDLAKKIVRNRLNYFEGREYPMLINQEGLKGVERDAREYLSSDEAIQGIVACAIVSKSAFEAFMANFFIKIAVIRPKFPVRMFSTDEEAFEWLEKYKRFRE